MKIFIYKCLIASFIFFILFQITIGFTIKKVEKQIYNLSSEENKKSIKEKIRKELISATQKDRYINEEDAKIIKKFIEKIKIELK
tara:strand:+ start:804 stop:1058 length:255 start_codon:yes stop_codon:yes gene_type:complete